MSDFSQRNSTKIAKEGPSPLSPSSPEPQASLDRGRATGSLVGGACTMSTSDQAKLPHNPTFVRLGKAVWFTLEHSQRARGAGAALEEGLSNAKDENDEIALMGLAWMQVGEFEDRRSWSDEQWVAFLRAWQHKSGYVFGDHADEEEKVLIDAYTMYWTFYAALPKVPEGAPDNVDIKRAEAMVNIILRQFEERLGDPLLQCNWCKKCALGKRLLRCSRCQSAFYCDADCQKKDWKMHKKACNKK